MRLMSFAATKQQMRDGTKTVTRRLDSKGYWMRALAPGTLICAVEKGQGIPKGESIQRIGVIEIVDVRREPLAVDTGRCGERFIPNRRFEHEELRMEGFEDMMSWTQFVNLFCAINKCSTNVDVTRIEFRHRPSLTVCCGAKRKVITHAYTDDIRVECSKCGGEA